MAALKAVRWEEMKFMLSPLLLPAPCEGGPGGRHAIRNGQPCDTGLCAANGVFSHTWAYGHWLWLVDRPAQDWRRGCRVPGCDFPDWDASKAIPGDGGCL